MTEHANVSLAVQLFVLTVLLSLRADAQVEFDAQLPSPGAAESAAELERQAFEMLFGLDRSGDIESVMRLLTLAADAGSAAAADRLSLAYAAGDGVPMDRDEALRLQRQAAEAGSAFAQFRMGLQYVNRDMDDADLVEARRWLEASAAQGDRRALFALAGTYLGATVAETDMDAVLALVSRSAELGEPEALRQLGRLSMSQPGRLNPEKGIYALELVADTFPELKAEIGFLYFNGARVERDLTRAARWLSDAATRGDPTAQLLFSLLLQRGAGVARNTRLAEQMQSQLLQSATDVEKNNWAWTLSVSQDSFARDGDLAVRLMESLLDSSGDLTASRLDTLAAAYAEAGRFDDAVAAQQRAIDRFMAEVNDGTANAEQAQPRLADLHDRLDLYASGVPYRVPE